MTWHTPKTVFNGPTIIESIERALSQNIEGFFREGVEVAGGRGGGATLKDLDHRLEKIYVKHGYIQEGEAFRRRRQRVNTPLCTLEGLESARR